MTNYIDKALTAHRHAQAQLQTHEEDQGAAEDRLINEVRAKFAQRCTAALAKVIEGDAGDPEFAELTWEFTARPVVHHDGGAYYNGDYLTPGDSRHFTLRTTFERIPIRCTKMGPGRDCWHIFAVETHRGGVGFNSLASFGAALEPRLA